MRLRALIIRRVLVSIPVLVGVTAVTFAVSHSVPGDPARAIAGIYASDETVEQVREKWALDKPIFEQYVIYMKRLFQGDLGTSISTNRPVASDLGGRLPATLELTLFALVLMCVVGIGLGTAGAVWKNKPPDHAARFVAVMGIAIPSFFVALVFQLIFYRYLGWLPVSGRLSDSIAPPPHRTGFYTADSVLAGRWDALWDTLRHLLLPGITLALLGIAGITRMTRASLLDVFEHEYVRFAIARGLRKRTIVIQHALRNALLPTVTVIGLYFGALISGAVVIEYVFAWPGIGSYAVSGITGLDYTAIMGVALVSAVIYLICNLAVDVTYIILDPRVGEDT